MKGGCETKASILSSIVGASETGATDATWQCSGHRLATRPRQTVAAPPRFHDNSLETNTMQRHLPRQEKARSCPAPLMHSKAGRRAGIDLPWEDPSFSCPARGIPCFPSKVPPRIGDREPRPLCFLQAELVEVFLLWRADNLSFPLPPRIAKPGRTLAVLLSPKCACSQAAATWWERPRVCVWGGSSRAQYLLDLPLVWGEGHTSRHRSQSMLCGQGHDFPHRTVGLDTATPGSMA